MSLMAMLLCFTMLLGTTYAWFTDSVTNGVNKIVSGNLDVELYHMNYAEAVAAGSVNGMAIPKDEEGYKVGVDTKLFLNKDGEEMLWEPGATSVENFRIVNEGSLALKYQFKIAFANATETPDGKTLADIINISASEIEYAEDTGYPHGVAGNATLDDRKLGDGHVFEGYLLPGEEYNFWVGLQWVSSDIDNEFNVVGGLSIDIGVTLVATQYTYEKDNYNGDQYDAGATYPNIADLFPVGNDLYLDTDNDTYVAFSTEGLSSVAALASSDSSITSVTYVTDDGEVDVPVARNTATLNEDLSSGNKIIVLAEGTYTVGGAAKKEVTLVGTENTKVSVTSGLTYVAGSTITFEGITIQSEPEGAGYTNGLADATYAIYNNCVINGTLGLDFSCEFNNCEFNISGDYYNVWTWGAGTVSFNGCTFNCDGKALLVYPNILDNGTSHHTVNITNCVFNDNGDDTITGKAAIEITDTYPANNLTYDVIITNTTVNGFSTTSQNATTFGGTELGTNVWGNKNLLTTADLNVVIDGVDVH